MTRLWLVVLLLPVLLTGCGNRDERIRHGIRAELEGILYDFDSYEPDTTVVDTLFEPPHVLSGIVELARQMNQPAHDIETYTETYTKARKRAALWNHPYRSAYAQNEYEEALARMEECRRRIDMCQAEIVEIMKEMYPLVNSARGDRRKPQGWVATQRFRCRTDSGDPALADYVFVFDRSARKCELAIPADEWNRICELLERLDGVDESTFMQKLEELDIAGELPPEQF
ncbi:MAG: hypothetical protein K2H14_01140 [Muribaculaceae bacterium]|nr:hypothetical protein [Muribaculaceae bacterium]